MNARTIFDSYENTPVLHYTELEDEIGRGIPWDELESSDISGMPLSIQRRSDRKLYVHTTPDTHALAIGATRCGKTQSFVIPFAKFLTTRKNKCSMILSDPKLEIYRALAPTLYKQNYKIIHLNFVDPDKSIRWNPLTKSFDLYQEYLHVEDKVAPICVDGEYAYEFNGKTYKDFNSLSFAVNARKRRLLSEVQDGIESLVNVICVPGAEKDVVWMNGAASIFKGILFAMLEDSVPGDYPLITRDNFSLDTFLNILECIGNRDDPFTKKYFNRRDKMTSMAYRYVKDHLLIKAEITRDGYISTLSSSLTKIRDGAVREITCANNLDFSEFDDGAQPTAIFISMKDESKLHYQMISIFLKDLYTELIAMTRKNNNTPRKNPFYFILDEFGNIPKFNDFDTVISSCGGRNIWFWLVIQSYAQLNNVYGADNAKIIRDNLNMRIFLGTNDYDTKKSISAECGQKTIFSPISAMAGSGEDIVNHVRDTIAAVPVSKLSELDIGEAVIIRMNEPVVYSKLERYYTCPELQEEYRDEYDYVSDFVPGDSKYEYKIELCDDDDDDYF